MENDQWVYGSRDTYTYDTNSNMLTHLYENRNNDQWWLRYRNTCTYDIQNNIISFWNHWWSESDSTWVQGDLHLRDSFRISDGAGNDYYFRECYNITFIYKLIVTEVESQNGEIPVNYSLSQNYPNPFNPITKIQYSIPQSSRVVIKVFDILGSEIETLVNEEKPAGIYELNWNAVSAAGGLPSGVYFYQLRAGDYTSVKKMLLIK
jgi:hypothetical protein